MAGGYNGTVANNQSERTEEKFMHSVNITELKNNLSRYLEQAIAGEEIIIRDHDLAVARLAPMNGSGTATDELLKLAAEGKIRLGEGAFDYEYWKLKLPRVASDWSARTVRRRESSASLHKPSPRKQPPSAKFPAFQN